MTMAIGRGDAVYHTIASLQSGDGQTDIMIRINNASYEINIGKIHYSNLIHTEME